MNAVSNSTHNASIENSRHESLICDMKDWITEQTTFAWRFVWAPRTLGTPFICSPFVAREILRYVDVSPEAPARTYLEAGPGTGAMSHHLIKRLRPQDKLYLVEIDPSLAELLKNKYSKLNNVFVQCIGVQDWAPPTGEKIDAIITTVPLNSLPSAEVLANIFESFKRVIKPGGIISSVEYVGTSSTAQLFFFGALKETIDKIVEVKNKFFEEYSFERKIVLANIPPARVTHCRV